MTYRDAVDEDESDDDFPADAGSDEEEYEEVVCIINTSTGVPLKTEFHSTLIQRMRTPWMYFYQPMQRRDGHSPTSSSKSYKMRKRVTMLHQWSAVGLVVNRKVMFLHRCSTFTLTASPESKGLDPTAGLDPKVVAVYTKLVSLYFVKPR